MEIQPPLSDDEAHKLGLKQEALRKANGLKRRLENVGLSSKDEIALRQELALLRLSYNLSADEISSQTDNLRAIMLDGTIESEVGDLSGLEDIK